MIHLRFSSSLFLILLKLRWRHATRLKQLSILSRNTNLNFINIVLKVPFLLLAVWENHASVAMLDSSYPLTLITGAICPIHFTISISLVILVLSFESVATSPLELAKTAFLIVNVIAFVRVALGPARAAPLAFSMFHSVEKVTNICCATTPCVLSFLMWFSVNIFACVTVSIYKKICACAML